MDHFRGHGRKMQWRESEDPYHVFVSEVMLQQTQVSRVKQKFGRFVIEFPDFKTLAQAPLSRIYEMWQGLGYNRRAISLKKAAQIIMTEYHGQLPATEDALTALPGIGQATASSIMAFAFNLPVVFIETNIRTVFIHFFFKKKNLVSDEDLRPLVRKCLDRKNPRVWYWALMDYGAMLKSSGMDKNNRSRHYKKQSRFEGSRRQVRGAVLKALLSNGCISADVLAETVPKPAAIIGEILAELAKEGFISKVKGKFKLQEEK